MRDIMYKYFEQLLKERNIKTSVVSRETGIPYSAFSDWKAGRSTPKADKLQRIAAYFNVSMDYFLTGSNSPENTISDSERRILSLYRKLNATGKIEALKRISELAELTQYTEKKEKSSVSKIG